MKVISNRISITYFLLFLLFISSSFDIILNLKIEGFSFRFVFLVAILLFFYQILFKIPYVTKFRLIGVVFFFIWFLFLVLFITNTTLIKRNIGYLFWLFWNVLIVHCITIIFYNSNENLFYRLINLYIYSFLIIALLGILQFVLGLFNIDFLVAQWWVMNRIPRINGFTYEPSYFATYLIIPWATTFYLILNSTTLTSNKFYKLSFFIITIAIILSSSRIGILLIAFFTVIYFIKTNILSLLQLKIKVKSMLILLTTLIVILVAFIYSIINFNKISFLLNGTGIANTSSHSSEGRWNEMKITFDAFLQSPIIGYSLGGVSSAIGKLRGIAVVDQSIAKTNEGMNVYLEILAASGIIGFIFFILFIMTFILKFHKLGKRLKYIQNTKYIFVRAFLLGLILELIILIFNQNILRPYLWVHIGMINGIYFYINKNCA